MEYPLSMFGEIPYGCDVPAWIAYLTADQMNVDQKLMIDDDGELVTSIRSASHN